MTVKEIIQKICSLVDEYQVYKPELSDCFFPIDYFSPEEWEQIDIHEVIKEYNKFNYKDTIADIRTAYNIFNEPSQTLCISWNPSLLLPNKSLTAKEARKLSKAAKDKKFKQIVDDLWVQVRLAANQGFEQIECSTQYSFSINRKIGRLFKKLGYSTDNCSDTLRISWHWGKNED